MMLTPPGKGSMIRSITESLQVQHVYKGNANLGISSRASFFQAGGNSAQPTGSRPNHPGPRIKLKTKPSQIKPNPDLNPYFSPV